MIYKKTAALAEMCCSIGGQLCGASAKEIKAVSNYGKNLGMAFQIQDDLLDIVGEENQIGKTIGSDLVEGKKTYLFLRALEKSNVKDRTELIKVIKQKGIPRSEIQKYSKLYFKLRVIKDAEHEIMKYTKLALKNLSSLKNGEGKNLMFWLATALITRNK
jgi:geranylgeranyl pyrophosphate synthase